MAERDIPRIPAHEHVDPFSGAGNWLVPTEQDQQDFEMFTRQTIRALQNGEPWNYDFKATKALEKKITDLDEDKLPSEKWDEVTADLLAIREDNVGKQLVKSLLVNVGQIPSEKQQEIFESFSESLPNWHESQKEKLEETVLPKWDRQSRQGQREYTDQFDQNALSSLEGYSQEYADGSTTHKKEIFNRIVDQLGKAIANSNHQLAARTLVDFYRQAEGKDEAQIVVLIKQRVTEIQRLGKEAGRDPLAEVSPKSRTKTTNKSEPTKDAPDKSKPLILLDADEQSSQESKTEKQAKERETGSVVWRELQRSLDKFAQEDAHKDKVGDLRFGIEDGPEINSPESVRNFEILFRRWLYVKLEDYLAKNPNSMGYVNTIRVVVGAQSVPVSEIMDSIEGEYGKVASQVVDEARRLCTIHNRMKAYNQSKKDYQTQAKTMSEMIHASPGDGHSFTLDNEAWITLANLGPVAKENGVEKEKFAETFRHALAVYNKMSPKRNAGCLSREDLIDMGLPEENVDAMLEDEKNILDHVFLFSKKHLGTHFDNLTLEEIPEYNPSIFYSEEDLQKLIQNFVDTQQKISQNYYSSQKRGEKYEGPFPLQVEHVNGLINTLREAENFKNRSLLTDEEMERFPQEKLGPGQIPLKVAIRNFFPVTNQERQSIVQVNRERIAKLIAPDDKVMGKIAEDMAYKLFVSGMGSAWLDVALVADDPMVKPMHARAYRWKTLKNNDDFGNKFTLDFFNSLMGTYFQHTRLPDDEGNMHNLRAWFIDLKNVPKMNLIPFHKLGDADKAYYEDVLPFTANMYDLVINGTEVPWEQTYRSGQIIDRVVDEKFAKNIQKAYKIIRYWVGTNQDARTLFNAIDPKGTVPDVIHLDNKLREEPEVQGSVFDIMKSLILDEIIKAEWKLYGEDNVNSGRIIPDPYEGRPVFSGQDIQFIIELLVNRVSGSGEAKGLYDKQRVIEMMIESGVASPDGIRRLAAEAGFAFLQGLYGTNHNRHF